ncbi:MAG TPA: DsbA family protein [Anaerolineales bacterium]|nr:DsbA family protein [Anaerolineales bacterium]
MSTQQDTPSNSEETFEPARNRYRTQEEVIEFRWSQLAPWLIAPLLFALGLGAGYLIWGLSGGRAASSADSDLLVAVATQVASIEGGSPAVTADDDPWLGSESAKVTIIEFADVQCPYCYRFRTETLPQIMEKYGDQVRFVARDFPLTSIHPEALPGAIAAECVYKINPTAYFPFSTALFNNQAQLGQELYRSLAVSNGVDQASFDSCNNNQETLDEVRKDFNDARKAGVNSTPHFFINGVSLVGAQPFEVFDQEIQAALDAAQ